MAQYTNEPPEDLDAFLTNLKFYIDKSYSGADKEELSMLLKNASVDVVKTGNWGKIWGYAEAKANFFVEHRHISDLKPAQKGHLREATFKILQSLNCGLEIVEIDFIPSYSENISKTSEEELTELVEEVNDINKGIRLPKDLISKGKEMSEAYLYIYVVENTLRLFIEQVKESNQLTIPAEVAKTIAKNKGNEAQNRFLPLRANDDLFYCDFVQLQQIMSNNWGLFKDYFPHRDEHWLRVKIEDMYRVRNLIAHCGFISSEELQMIKANFNMIVRQLTFN